MNKACWLKFGVLITLLYISSIGFWLKTASPLSILHGPKSLNRTLGFDHIYVINLCYRHDRRRRTKAIADKLGLDFDFFPAVSKYDEKTLDEFEGNYQNNHKACFISHYRVFQSIAENDYSSTLILEDDVDMEMDIIPIITGIHDILPTDWETLFIGHCGLDSRGEILGESHGIGLFKSNHPLCTHAYAVSSAGVHKFLKEFTVADSPIDVKFYFEIKKGNINSYSLNPAPIVQARSPSDLTPGEEPDEDLRNSTLRFLGLRK